jgi:hypothetical protein
VRFGDIIEKIRDRLVQRSLVGKRKLDRTATRRALDGALRDVGERYRELVRAGRMEVPPELQGPMQHVRFLEDRLDSHQREITALEDEQPSET